MRIVVGSDHAGFELKSKVAALLREAGHEISDVGTHSSESTDYPIYAHKAAGLVASGECERAVLLCGSGAGVSIAANKVQGIRAVHAHDTDEAQMSRRHNNANVLTLAGRHLDQRTAQEIVEAFLGTQFEGGRHERRVDQIAEIERSHS
jgi:ribose 5-phosphate isomerase B